MKPELLWVLADVLCIPTSYLAAEAWSFPRYYFYNGVCSRQLARFASLEYNKRQLSSLQLFCLDTKESKGEATYGVD